MTNMDQSMEPVIRKTRLSDEVSHHLRQAILTGELRPGMPIRQAEWADRLQVSRMPIRDALAQLEGEGLVRSSRSGRVTVASLSRQDILDGYSLAAIVAGMVTRRATGLLTIDDMKALTDHHLEMVSCVDSGDVAGATSANILFHKTIYRACESPRLLAFMRTLNHGIPRFSISAIPAWRHEACASHERILSALRDREADLAERHMEEHVLASGRHVLKYLNDQGFWER